MESILKLLRTMKIQKIKKQILTSIFIVLISTLLLGSYIFQTSKTALDNSAKKILTELLESEKSLLEILSKDWSNFLIAISQHPTLKSYAQMSFSKNQEEMNKLKPKLEKLFYEYNQLKPEVVKYMRFIGTNGVEEVLVKNSVISKTYKDRNNRPYFNEIKTQKIGHLNPPTYRKGTSYTGLDWSIAIGDGEKFHGVFTITLDTTVISQLINPSIKAGGIDSFYLLDKKGLQIIGPDNKNFEKPISYFSETQENGYVEKIAESFVVKDSIDLLEGYLLILINNKKITNEHIISFIPTVIILSISSIIILILLSAFLIGTHRRTRALSDLLNERRIMNDELTYQAYHDHLTGLPNRAAFERKARLILIDTIVHKSPSCLIYIDLDKFKLINDSSGHTAGDEFLIALAERINNKLRKTDLFSRLGGDEFGILFENCTIKEAINRLEIVLKDIENFVFNFNGKNHKVGLSIGVSLMNEFTKDIDQAMGEADLACYCAKHSGRNQIKVFDTQSEEMNKAREHTKWVEKIEDALVNNQFILHAQKIKYFTSNTSPCYEILIRLLDIDGKIIAPGHFLPSAERFGLIAQIDRWVIKNTINLISQTDQLHCSINLSGDSIKDPKLLSFINDTIKHSKIEPGRLTFEITESIAIGNIMAARKLVTSIKSIGCMIALDDFGTGLSSFSYLKHLPIDILKIDKSFIDDILTDVFDKEFSNSMVHIAKALSIKTVAEGVENIATVALLKELEVDAIQGYVIHRPEPLNNIISILNEK